jgi:hypothetical protein
LFPKIENDRIDVRKEAHRRDSRRAANRRVREHIEFQIADVPRQNLDFLKAAVDAQHLFRHRFLVGGAGFRLTGGLLERIVDHVQMLVVADRLQMLREQGGNMRSRCAFARSDGFSRGIRWGQPGRFGP